MTPESLRGSTLYFDCFAGIAGDMALGALLDLGVPEELVRLELARLPISGYRLERERVMRGALSGTKIHVHTFGHEDAGRAPRARAGLRFRPSEAASSASPSLVKAPSHAHTDYRAIRALLTASLSGDVLARSLAIFDKIAVVEARLHGVTVEEVAFHEVGAVDSIVDIVGTAAALAWLEPARVISRRVPLGGGTVETAHGRLPVPAPATLELLIGAEVEAGGDSELTTPTGAAILAATVTAYGPMPPLVVTAVGWGAGDRQLADRPNLLRVVAGQPPASDAAADLVVVEANVDDMNPELFEPLLEALFAAGAVDAWLAPIIMKKGRPAHIVAALCEAGKLGSVSDALFRESTTIGVRHQPVSRTVLPRHLVEVDTPWGKIPLKVAGSGDEILNAAPEYEACRRAAREHKVPVKRVYLAALGAFYRR